MVSIDLSASEQQRGDWLNITWPARGLSRLEQATCRQSRPLQASPLPRTWVICSSQHLLFPVPLPRCFTFPPVVGCDLFIGEL